MEAAQGTDALQVAFLPVPIIHDHPGGSRLAHTVCQSAEGFRRSKRPEIARELYEKAVDETEQGSYERLLCRQVPSPAYTASPPPVQQILTLLDRLRA